MSSFILIATDRQLFSVRYFIWLIKNMFRLPLMADLMTFD